MQQYLVVLNLIISSIYATVYISKQLDKITTAKFATSLRKNDCWETMHVCLYVCTYVNNFQV